MELPKQKWGVLLFFPSKESATRRPTKQSCPECRRLEDDCDAAMQAIQRVIRGAASTSQKITVTFSEQPRIYQMNATLARTYSRLISTSEPAALLTASLIST